mgnify:CR=1 FL=1
MATATINEANDLTKRYNDYKTQLKILIDKKAKQHEDYLLGVQEHEEDMRVALQNLNNGREEINSKKSRLETEIRLAKDSLSATDLQMELDLMDIPSEASWNSQMSAVRDTLGKFEFLIIM